MPSYTTSLRLIQPATGEYSGTWGTQVNNGITALVDAAVAGTASITMTAADYTLSNNNGASDEARAMFLVLGGTPGAARNVICPAVSKLYYVTNNTTGGFAQTVKTSAGTGISVPNGASMVLRCDGTNVVEALNAFGSLTINTGKVLLSNGQSYAVKSSGGAVNDVIGLTAGNVLILGGGGATDSIQFWNQGLQRMTLDSSGNLGIGTSSPGEKLAVNQGNIYALRTGGAKLRLADQNNEVSVESSPTGVVSNMIFKTAAATQMTLDSSGNLGIGTTSPTQRLDVVTTSATVAKFTRDLATDVSLTIGADTDGAILGTDGVNVMRMFTGGTERMRLDASGNIGLNGTSPSAWFGYKALQSDQSSLYESSNTVGLSSNSYFPSAGINWTRISAVATARYDISSGVHKWFADASGAAGGSFTPTERMQLDNSGNLLLGTTSVLGTTRFNVVNSSGPAIYASGSTAGARFDSPLNGTETVQVVNTDTTGNNLLVSFYTDSAPTFRGAITYNRGTGLISYGTSSDYRAKDIIGPVQDPGATIDALKVYEGKMKGATQSRPMLVAHEAQAVAPYCVTGEKDEVNEDGTPKFQQMDVSSLVPLLLAEIQSLRARVAALEAK